MKRNISLSILILSLTACGTTKPPTIESAAWKQVNNLDENGQYDRNKISSRFNGKRCITIPHRKEQLLLAQESFHQASVTLEKANSEFTLASLAMDIASENKIKAYELYEEALKNTDESKRNAAIKSAEDKLAFSNKELKSANKQYDDARSTFSRAKDEFNQAKSELRIANSYKSDTNEFVHDELCKAYSFADFYRQKYIEMSSNAYTLGTGLDALGLLAGLAGVTSVAFNWHEDALISSALTLGAAMGVKSYTQPGQRSDLYLQGAQRMQCIVNTSPRILNNSIDSDKLDEMKKDVTRTLRALNSITPETITAARNTTPTEVLTSEKITQHVDEFLKLQNNSLEIQKEMTRNISLIEGMPDTIILATKEAELKFNQSFVSSAPDFNKSLGIIQSAISQQILNQQQIQKLDALFPATSSTSNSKERDNNAQLYDTTTPLNSLIKITNDLRNYHQALMSEIVNYTDVSAALKLCNAI
ncbi:TPA: hypothetical protein P0E07_000947 [Vibrio fluvialis]|nr:hypothetical protein [Vibrio fluvialis]